MNNTILIISTLLVFIMAGYAFYITFKKHSDDDDFLAGANTFTLIDLLFGVIALISEKYASKKYQIIIFKVSSFLWGTLLIAMIIFLWVY